MDLPSQAEMIDDAKHNDLDERRNILPLNQRKHVCGFGG